MRRLLAPILTALLLLTLASPASAESPRSPQDCATHLNCSIDDIDRMSMPARGAFIRAMSAGLATELLPAYATRWGNIEGVVDFFGAEPLGAPGSWVSYVDAGIIEGFERGIAIALGRSADTFGNPGSLLWASYVQRLADGQLTDRAAHDKAWSEAEQASTERGAAYAEQVHGMWPSAAERRMYVFSEVYRWVLRNRPAPFADPVGKGDQTQALFLNWFTDVTNPTPARKGIEFAYRYGQFNVPSGTIGVLDMFRVYAEQLWDDFQADTGAAVPAPSSVAGHTR